MLGQRCHAIRSICGHQGLITAHTEGTIKAEINNLGRHLIAVHWDTGLEMYVFPDEIEIHQTPEEGYPIALIHDSIIRRASIRTTNRQIEESRKFF